MSDFPTAQRSRSQLSNASSRVSRAGPDRFFPSTELPPAPTVSRRDTPSPPILNRGGKREPGGYGERPYLPPFPEFPSGQAQRAANEIEEMIRQREKDSIDRPIGSVQTALLENEIMKRQLNAQELGLQGEPTFRFLQNQSFGPQQTPPNFEGAKNQNQLSSSYQNQNQFSSNLQDRSSGVAAREGEEIRALKQIAADNSSMLQSLSQQLNSMVSQNHSILETIQGLKVEVQRIKQQRDPAFGQGGEIPASGLGKLREEVYQKSLEIELLQRKVDSLENQLRGARPDLRTEFQLILDQKDRKIQELRDHQDRPAGRPPGASNFLTEWLSIVQDKDHRLEEARRRQDRAFQTQIGPSPADPYELPFDEKPTLPYRQRRPYSSGPSEQGLRGEVVVNKFLNPSTRQLEPSRPPEDFSYPYDQTAAQEFLPSGRRTYSAAPSRRFERHESSAPYTQPYPAIYSHSLASEYPSVPLEYPYRSHRVSHGGYTYLPQEIIVPAPSYRHTSPIVQRAERVIEYTESPCLTYKPSVVSPLTTVTLTSPATYSRPLSPAYPSRIHPYPSVIERVLPSNVLSRPAREVFYEYSSYPSLAALPREVRYESPLERVVLN